jgi:hypothetical protein
MQVDQVHSALAEAQISIEGAKTTKPCRIGRVAGGKYSIFKEPLGT